MLWLMFPAYNEKENLVKLLPNIVSFLKDKIKNYKIVIIDDGSTDSTKNLIEHFKGTVPMEMISHETNKGVGKVFYTGFSAISKMADKDDSLIVLEADGTSDYRLIPILATKLQQGNDIAIASRYIKGGAYKNFPLKRYLISLIGNIILGIVFSNKNIKDYTIFYRGYKMGLIKNALEMYGAKFITSDTFLANTEILLNLTRLTDKITEIPFIYSYDLKIGKSKMPLVKTLLDYLKFLVANLFRKSP